MDPCLSPFLRTWGRGHRGDLAQPLHLHRSGAGSAGWGWGRRALCCGGVPSLVSSSKGSAKPWGGWPGYCEVGGLRRGGGGQGRGGLSAGKHSVARRALLAIGSQHAHCSPCWLCPSRGHVKPPKSEDPRGRLGAWQSLHVRCTSVGSSDPFRGGLLCEHCPVSRPLQAGSARQGWSPPPKSHLKNWLPLTLTDLALCGFVPSASVHSLVTGGAGVGRRTTTIPQFTGTCPRSKSKRPGPGPPSEARP